MGGGVREQHPAGGKWRAPGRAAAWLLRLVRRVSPLAMTVLLLAAAGRMTVRDSWAVSAPFFYALPLPVQAAGWLVLAVAAWRVSKLRRALCVLAALACGLWWTLHSWRLLPRRELSVGGTVEVKVLFWNIGHTRQVPDKLPALLAEKQPELVALAESENLPPAALASLAAVPPGYQFLRMPDGMIAMARGSLKFRSSRRLGQGSTVHVLEAQLTAHPGVAWRFVLCDVGPWPPLPRTQILNEQLADAGPGPRTIVVGDFNTPGDSAGFDAWHAQFRHGFSDCRDYHGPLETWGWGLPLLPIDHQWASPDLTPVRAEKGSRIFMDHQWLCVTWHSAGP